MPEISRCRSQITGLFFIVLLVGQEIQAVVNSTTSNGFSERPGHDQGSDGAVLQNFSEPPPLVAQLALNGGAAPRSLRLEAGWSWAPGTTLTIDTKKDGDIIASTSDTKVLVVANLAYVNLAISEGTGYAYDTEWINSQVKLVKDIPEVERQSCSTNKYDVAMGIAQSGGTAGAQSDILSYLGWARRRYGPLPLSIDTSREGRLFVEGMNINFMHGGSYQLCFTPDLPFGGDDTSVAKENILSVKIQVLGIKSPCTGFYEDGCIRQERWECSFGYKGEGPANCEFNFATDAGRKDWAITVEAGHISKMTWGAAYGSDDLDPSGNLKGTLKEASNPKQCGAPGSAPADLEFDTAAGGVYQEISRVKSVTLPVVQVNQKDAFTVAACYCPNFDYVKGSFCDFAGGDSPATCKACDQPEDFIQFFGTIYYWTIRICDGGNVRSEYEVCKNPYMRVIPQQKFTLRIDCPPGGGCLPSWDNRIKFLEPKPANEKPNWHSDNGCKTTEAETPKAVWPYQQDVLTVPGGPRVDYKVWHTKQDNSPAQVKINLSLNRKLDVCFANENSEDSDSWFRIGQIETSASFAFASSASKNVNTPSALFHLKYVDEPGTITLYGGMKTAGNILNPYDGNKYSGKALINILSYDRDTSYGSKAMGTDKTIETYLSDLELNTPDNVFQDSMDAECGKGLYNGELIRVMEPDDQGVYTARGTWTEMSAARVMAQIDPGTKTTRVEKFMPFTGPSSGQEALQVVKAGVVSVCYCAIVTSEDRCDTGYGGWIYVGSTTVRGPTGMPPPPAERWQFDTDIVVNIRMEGWGLSGCDPTEVTGQAVASCPALPNRDRLRIISQGECTDSGNSPGGTDSFRIRCPGPNDASTAATVACDSAQADTDLQMLADTALSTQLFIESYTVAEEKTTLTFSDDISSVFEDGDHITLDLDRIKIDGKYFDAMENHEKFELFKFTGEYHFMDMQQDYYWLSHKVKLVRGGAKINQVTIPVGWHPSKDPGFTFQDNKGWWTRRNKIYSQTEIKGKGKSSRPAGVEASTAKVCWGVSGQYGQRTKYYAQAGEIEFLDPFVQDPAEARKEGTLATVSLTTYENEAIAPVVITFTTSDMPGYMFGPGSSRKTQLMLRFLDIASEGNGQLVPHRSQDRSPGSRPYIDSYTKPQAYEDDEQVTKMNAEQYVCGLLFVELWSKDDDDGFPLPASCYYGPKHRDAKLYPTGNLPCADDEEYCQEPKFYREFYIEFGDLNGLKAGKEYQIVMNAKTTDVVKDNVLLDLYAMCSEETGCARPYEVFEKIPVYAAASGRRSTTDSLDISDKLTMTPSLSGNSQWAPGGEAFLIQRGDDKNVVSLDAENTIQVKLTGSSKPGESIRRDQVLRIFLWPVTLWETGSSCNAFCEKHHASNTKCEGTVTCETQQVVKNGNRNIIKLTLPTDMDEINEAIQHTIQVNGFASQTWGFFPTRLGAELRDEQDEGPTYTTSAGYVKNDPDKGACSMKSISGAQQWVCDRSTRTVGMLVLDGRTGYGPKPFAGQTDNVLYVRLQFGATLWHNSAGVDAAYFIIFMPGSATTPAFKCVAMEQPPVDLAVFQVDKDLEYPGYVDNPRGVLNFGGGDGTVRAEPLKQDYSARECEYRLGSRQAIFAKQVAYMKIIVHNPDTPMRKDLPNNFWSVALMSKGQIITDTPYEMDPVRFVSLGVEQTYRSALEESEPALWGSNAAVLSRLDDDSLTDMYLPLLQPSDFRSSCCGAYTERITENKLNLFFRTTENIGRGGYIIVDAPDGFDFALEDQNCVAGHLEPETYYAFIGIGNGIPRLNKLRDMGVCMASKYPYRTAKSNNRAILQVRGTIEDAKWYGFTMSVINPVFYEVTQHGTIPSESKETGWYLFMENSMHYTIEGTEHTIQFNRVQAPGETDFYHRSWGMYKEACDVTPHITDMRFSESGEFVDVIFYPIQINDRLGVTDTSLRVTAPEGYQWSPDESAFQAKTNGTTLMFLEVGYPEVKNENQLIFPSLSLTGRDLTGPVRYGFRHKIRVPEYSPVTSSNSFFLEWGFQESCVAGIKGCSGGTVSASAGDGGGRIKACVEPAPMVAALTNAIVAYATNLVSWEDNFLEFHVQTVTTLQNNEGIVIRGDAGTVGFQFKNEFKILDGSDILPGDARVLPETSASNLPRVVIKAVGTPIPAGFYKIEIPVSNPTSKTAQSSNPGNWDFGTYKQVTPWTEQSKVIDKVITAPGFRINEKMADARLLNSILDTETDKLIQTNYRPGEPNQLVFRFTLRNTPTELKYMIIRGPRGFEFDEDCLDQRGPHRIITNRDLVFGNAMKWNPDITEWAGNGPVSCVGLGRQATIGVPIGLQRNTIYAFRIGVRSNPMTTPSPWNRWSMDFNGETSEPFPGFPIWTNTNMKIIPSSNASSPDQRATTSAKTRTQNPIEIMFQPQNTIPTKSGPSLESAGYIRLKAPATFTFVENNENGDCDVHLSEQGGIEFKKNDLLCQVIRSNGGTVARELTIIVNGDKVIEEGRMYTLIVYVFNPGKPNPIADQWEMESFANENEKLDKSFVKGFPVNMVLNTFDVINAENEKKGRARVNTVDIAMEFPDPVKDDDVIIMHAPNGFNIQGNPDIFECNEFEWRDVMSTFPSREAPKCHCDTANGLHCYLWWDVKEDIPGGQALPMNKPLKFKITTENPAQTPFITENFWRVSHMREGAVKSSDVYRSWDIHPQLEDVDIQLGSRGQAAGAESDLKFMFTPVSSADTIKIEAKFPTDFNFGQSRVDPPMDLDARTEQYTIIINRCDIQAGRQKEIWIYSVRLGRGGGKTTFNIATYDAALPVDEKQWDTLKRDEKFQFQDGFRLPGRITLSQQQLKSRFKEEQQLYPVKSLFQPRVDETAKAYFTIVMTQQARASEKLMIQCQGDGAYILKATPFVLIGTAQVPTTTQVATNGELQATLMPGRPSSEIALFADTPYKVIVQVIPKPGDNTWWFATWDGNGPYPTNTNDGAGQRFEPVERMELVVQTTRSPPDARTDVKLSVTGATKTIRELLIIAPPAFEFPPEGCGDMCRPGQALGSTGRRTATWASPTGDPLTDLSDLRIKVVTPEQTPDSTEWYVEGREQGGAGTTTGWGQGAGFLVEQMAMTAVAYPGVANLKGAQIVFTFSIGVNAGSIISVIPPTGYLLTCSTEGALKQISLPGNIPDCVDDPLELTLTRTLIAGEYAFGVAVDVPPQIDQSKNKFNIKIKNQENQVVDAAFGLQGQPIVPDLKVSNPTLSWTNSDPGARSTITFGLTFDAPTQRLRALLLNFPPKFIHDVLRPTDVVNLNKKFKVAAGKAGDWADTQFTDRVRIYLDDSDPTTIIEEGTYEFSLPVRVPCCSQEDMPPVNVWYLSLCEDRGCSQPGDNTILVTLPMAGFALDELAPAAARSTNGATQRVLPIAARFCMYLALFAPLAFLWRDW